MEDAVRLVLYLFVLAYSCILHECAHVWVALKLGDPTGKLEGRLTLNPLPHVDVFWTLILPALTFLSGRGALGGPKPAPVNPLNFRDPRSGFMWTSIAGPATNVLLAGLGLGFMAMGFALSPESLYSREERTVTYYSLFLGNVFFTNVFLAAFNLIPVPPLDGSRVLRFLLGRGGEGIMDRIEQFGLLALLVAAFALAPLVLRPVVQGMLVLLGNLFGYDYAYSLVSVYFKPVIRF